MAGVRAGVLLIPRRKESRQVEADRVLKHRFLVKKRYIPFNRAHSLTDKEQSLPVKKVGKISTVGKTLL